MNEFIRKYGIEAYNEVKAWNKDVEDVFVFGCLEDIEEEYDLVFNDAEDVFQHFENHIRAVVATGEFLIEKKF